MLLSKQKKVEARVRLVKLAPQVNTVVGAQDVRMSVGKSGRWGHEARVPRAAVAEKVAHVEEITLQPIKSISGKIKLPGSKSLSNRTLLLAALSQGTTVVKNLLDSEDVRYMAQALRTLGYKIEEERGENRLVIEGSGGVFPIARDAESSNEVVKLFLGNAGTAMRPLTACVAAAGGNLSYELDGVIPL